MMMLLRWICVLLLMAGLTACGGADKKPAGDDKDAKGGGGAGAAVEPEGGGDPDAEDVLVGVWYAVSQDGRDMPPDTLVFTYMADGTGTVVEERASTKAFLWTYDPDAGTLHVDTENEDMLFTATLDGDTLMLVMDVESGGEMRLVMRRSAGDGGE